MKKIIVSILMFLLLTLKSYGADQTKAHTWVDGETPTAALWNGNEDPLYTTINDIEAANLASDIAITTSGNCTFNGNMTIGNGADTHATTGVWTFNDNTSNGNCITLDNDGTGHGLYITQDGVLSATTYGLYLYSNAAQTNATQLLFVHQDNASSTQGAGGEAVALITNDGKGSTIDINGAGVLDHANGRILNVRSAVAQTTCDYVNEIGATSASTTKPLLKLSYAGSSTQIVGQGNENLSNAGVWTDRVSFFADKEDAKLVSAGYIDKLRDTKLYDYQKKAEIYGNEIEVERDGKKIKEYPKEKKNPNAKRYIGIILDEPTTPEELISRDLEGNINGKSGTQIAEFVLVVCQELIKENEALKARLNNLEARVLVLENKP